MASFLCGSGDSDVAKRETGWITAFFAVSGKLHRLFPFCRLCDIGNSSVAREAMSQRFFPPAFGHGGLLMTLLDGARLLRRRRIGPSPASRRAPRHHVAGDRQPPGARLSGRGLSSALAGALPCRARTGLAQSTTRMPRRPGSPGRALPFLGDGGSVGGVQRDTVAAISCGRLPRTAEFPPVEGSGGTTHVGAYRRATGAGQSLRPKPVS